MFQNIIGSGSLEMKVYLNQYYDLLPFSGIDRGVGGRRRGGGGEGGT